MQKTVNLTGKKIAAIALSAVLLVGGSVAGTMAYLTSQDTVKNTFTVGNVAITLDETDYDDSTEGADRDKANRYHLLPGQSYVKDPTVTVAAGSEDAYVRMKVTVSDIADLKAAFPAAEYYSGNMFLLQNLVSGWNPALWECVGYVETAEGTAVYEFRYTRVVEKSEAPTELAPLFGGVQIPAAIDNTHLANLQDIEIIVIAEAIQATGFNGDVDAAWAAFGTQA